MRGDSRSEELTIKEAALVVGGASALAARRRVERALEQHQLPWHWGLVGGRRLKMVYREDLVVWRSTLVEPAEAEGRDDNRRDDDDARDDGFVDANANADAQHDDSRTDTGVPPSGSLDEAQERVGAMLRDVQSGAIAEVGRQMQPLMQEIKAAYERIGRLEAENEELRRQAQETRRQHDDDDGGNDDAEGEQRRPWGRRWWTRLWGGS